MIIDCAQYQDGREQEPSWEPMTTGAGPRQATSGHVRPRHQSSPRDVSPATRGAGYAASSNGP